MDPPLPMVWNGFAIREPQEAVDGPLQKQGGRPEADIPRHDFPHFRQGGEWLLLRTALKDGAGKLLQAAGVAIPPPVNPAPRKTTRWCQDRRVSI